MIKLTECLYYTSYRIYRYGQTKKCFIYRLVSHGTFEKRMYERQVTKEGMSGAVKDEKLVVIVGNDCCFNSCFEFP